MIANCSAQRRQAVARRATKATTLSLAALCLAFLWCFPAKAWTRFGSDRYGTSAEVPDGYISRRAPDNGDGREVTSPDGKVTISIYATQDVLHAGLTPPTNVHVTYVARGPGWAVYSGLQGNRIVYERMQATCAGNALIHHVRIVYFEAETTRMASVVRHIARTLRGDCKR